ncbi:MAG: hypothetical protein ABSD59_00095 [Terracidiphilus sp.]
MRIPNEFRAILVFFFGVVWCLSGNALAAQTSADPVYVAISNGWIGLYGHGDEYAKFSMTGKEVKLQDAYHILLKPGLGMMVSFADKAEFGGGENLLDNHEKWELNYWKSKSDRAETVARKDLSGAREDVRVTEIKLYRDDGAQLHIFMIALASKDGVFVLAVSPGSSETDATVREIANSFTLVHRTLTAEEIARVSKAIKNGSEE